MSDFLCAKGYYFYIKIEIYKVDGNFVTRSQVPTVDIDAYMREEEIKNALRYGGNTYSREEIEKQYDEYYSEHADEVESTRQYYLNDYLRKYCRAHFQFRIENGVITTIELSDYYYSLVGSAYNDDGTVNEAYAYILDLK